jgi:hypothetical protein
MSDVSVIATLITTAGTLGGALGGIGLTSWTGIRREERQAMRQREEARAAIRQQAYVDLLGESAQIRIHIEITCQRQWRDMDVRLGRAQDYAVTIGLRAAHAALLSPSDVADAALNLGRAASKLAAWTAINANMGHSVGPSDHFAGGVVSMKPDFAELDASTAEFLRLVSAAFDKAPQIGPQLPQA